MLGTCQARAGLRTIFSDPERGRALAGTYSVNDCLPQCDETSIIVEESSTETPRMFSPLNSQNSVVNNYFWQPPNSTPDIY